MKKLILVALMCAMTATFAACGNDESSESKTTEDTKPSVSDATTTTTQEEKDESRPEEIVEDELSEYGMWSKALFHDVYLDYKNGYRDDTVSNGVVYQSSRDYMTGILNVDQDIEFNGTLEDVFEAIDHNMFFRGMDTKTDIALNRDLTYRMEMTSSENVTIENVMGEKIDCIRFTAEFTDEEQKTCYVYGYTFIIDGRPFMLLGYTCDDEQTEELKEIVRTDIDAMIQTVRTQRRY